MYVNHPIWPTKLQLTVTNTHSCVSQDFPLASASGIFSRPCFFYEPLAIFVGELQLFNLPLMENQLRGNPTTYLPSI